MEGVDRILVACYSSSCYGFSGNLTVIYFVIFNISTAILKYKAWNLFMHKETIICIGVGTRSLLFQVYEGHFCITGFPSFYRVRTTKACRGKYYKI